jgi:hypothetical protein
MKAQPIQTVLAAILMTAGIAAAQHPTGPHGVGPYGGPQFPSALPATPGWPASTSDPFPQLPASVSGVKSAPGVEENQGTSRMPPMQPPYMVSPPPNLPPDRNTTPPPEEVKAVVADRLRQADQTKPPGKLTGVEVELVQGGYLVTKKWEDYSAVLPDGRPAYLREDTYFVAENDVRVTQPSGTQPEPPRPPSPPFTHGPHDTPPTHKPREIAINPKDPFGLLDPAMDQLRRENQLRQVINDSLLEKHVREQRERADSVLSDESIAEMEAIIAAAGLAGLQTALTVGTLVPVAGTVIEGGTAFHDQYFKTRDTLLKNGVSPAEAHRRAFLQALVVGGVAVGADLATGSVLGKLKTVAKFKAFDKSATEFIAEAARKGKVSGKNVGLVKQGLDTGVDQAVVATGKTTIGTTTAIAGTLTAGGFGGGGGYRPAIAQRPSYGGNTYGARFRLP